MKSSSMYAFSHQEVKDDILSLIKTTPFLDINWLFHPEFDRARYIFRERPSNPSKRIGFSEFKKSISNQKDVSPLAMAIRRARLEMYREREENQLTRHGKKLIISSDYLKAMAETGATRREFHAHYDRIYKYVKNFHVYQMEASLLFESTIAPALLWRKSSILTEKDRVKLANKLESCIQEICNKIIIEGIKNKNIYVVIRLIYAYIISSEAWNIGLNPIVLSALLLIFRNCSADAWSSLTSIIRMQFAGLALHIFGRFYSFDEPFYSKLGFSHKTLADIRTLFQVSSQGNIGGSFATHQWVYRWLADKLDADVFSPGSQQVAKSAILRSLSEYEQLAIVELSRRFSAYRMPATTDIITNFVLQFGSPSRTRAALRLLSNVKFMPLWELSATIERILSVCMANRPEDRLIVAPLGDLNGSTAIIRYLAAHTKLKNIFFEDSIKSALKRSASGERIYFIDDCLLSGTQALSILGDWMGTREHKPHHTIYSSMLTKSEIREMQRREFVFAYCIATDFGKERFLNMYRETELDPKRMAVEVGVIDPISSKAFEPLGPVGWASHDECEDIKNFAYEIGYRLLENRAKEKNWTDERRRESALGYSNFQRLLVFPYNVPKTTLTFLWASGGNEFEWNPIFPGYD